MVRLKSVLLVTNTFTVNALSTLKRIVCGNLFLTTNIHNLIVIVCIPSLFIPIIIPYKCHSLWDFFPCSYFRMCASCFLFVSSTRSFIQSPSWTLFIVFRLLIFGVAFWDAVVLLFITIVGVMLLNMCFFQLWFAMPQILTEVPVFVLHSVVNTKRNEMNQQQPECLPLEPEEHKWAVLRIAMEKLQHTKLCTKSKQYTNDHVCTAKTEY